MRPMILMVMLLMGCGINNFNKGKKLDVISTEGSAKKDLDSRAPRERQPTPDKDNDKDKNEKALAPEAITGFYLYCQGFDAELPEAAICSVDDESGTLASIADKAKVSFQLEDLNGDEPDPFTMEHRENALTFKIVSVIDAQTAADYLSNGSVTMDIEVDGEQASKTFGLLEAFGSSEVIAVPEEAAVIEVSPPMEFDLSDLDAANFQFFTLSAANEFCLSTGTLAPAIITWQCDVLTNGVQWSLVLFEGRSYMINDRFTNFCLATRISSQ